MGFSFAKGDLQTAKEVQFSCQEQRHFWGEQISTNQYLLPSPLFFLFSFLICLKIDFLFNPRLWGCSSLLSFGAGQAESARTKPSCFFGKANAKVGWAKGGWQMTSLPGLLLCRITKLQKELVASLTHPCLTLARPGLSVCQKFLLF